MAQASPASQSQAPARPVAVTLPDGSVKSFDRAVTGAEIAAAIGPGLAKAALAIKLDGVVRDLAHPVAHDARVELVTRRDDDALELIPNSPKAFNNRAIALLRLAITADDDAERERRLAAALESADAALEVKDAYALGWANRAYVLWQMERLGDARESALRAREVNPTYRFNPYFTQALAKDGKALPPPATPTTSDG